MWKDPDIVINHWIKALYRRVFYSLEDCPFMILPDEYSSLGEAFALLSDLYNKLQDASRAGDIQRMDSIFRAGVLEISRGMEEGKNWQLAFQLAKIAEITASSVNPDTESVLNSPRSVFILVTHVVIHLLLGDENHVLVGVRGNQPAWQEVKTVTPDDGASLYESEIRFFDRSDLGILPEFRSRITPTDLVENNIEFPIIPNCWVKMGDLLEDAYYNQHFLPHPEGSLVSIIGVPEIANVIVKSKRGVDDPNYIDIIGVFSIGKKKCHIVVNGDLAQHRPSDATIGDFDLGNRNSRFLMWLLVRIYHDLVTVQEIQPNKLHRSKSLGAPDPPEAKISESLGWIFIPRKIVKKGTVPFRLPSPNPRSVTPHRVRGHKRLGNMSAEHREKIAEFEQETGLEVLHWIPDGFTFVRPHISPKGDSDCIKNLPRFIKNRIQEDLKKLLSETT